MRILIFTPVQRLYLNTLVAIHQFEWDEPLTWVQWRDNPSQDGRSNIVEAYNAARNILLRGMWDAMLTIEHDIIPPKTTIKKLVATGADLAYGLYCYRWPGHTWNAFAEGKHLSLDRDIARRVWGTVTTVTGYGLGCTLIRRHVLEALSFRIESDDSLHCDSHFCNDARECGFTQACDLSVRCGHVVNDYRIVWPDIEQRGFFRYTFSSED